MFVSKVLSEDSVENLCTLGRLVSTGDDLSDVKYVMPLSLAFTFNGRLPGGSGLADSRMTPF